MGKLTVSKISELRQKKGLTQRELAQAIGVTETTIRNYEKGRSILEWIERVVKLCQTLDCDPQDLIDYIEINGTSTSTSNSTSNP